MKILIRTLLLLLLLVIVGLFFVVRHAGGLVRAAVESGGERALGVETLLESASVRLFSGELDLDGLAVANPPGFQREHFLKLGRGSMAVSLGTLRSEVIEAPLLLFEGLELDLERRDRETNYGVILAHLEAQQGAKEPQSAPDPSQGPGKRFVIREVILRDVTAYVDFSALGRTIAKTQVELPELRLENVGEQSLSSLISQIVTAVMEASVQGLEGVLPADVLADFQAQVARLEDVGAELEEQVRERASEAAGELEEQLSETQKELEGEVQSAVEEGAAEVKKGLDKILGGKGDG